MPFLNEILNECPAYTDEVLSMQEQHWARRCIPGTDPAVYGDTAVLAQVRRSFKPLIKIAYLQSCQTALRLMHISPIIFLAPMHAYHVRSLPMHVIIGL